MKKRILLTFLLLFATMSFGAQSPDSELKKLEATVEKLANTPLPDFAPELFHSVRAKLREARAIYDKEGRVPQGLIIEALNGLKTFDDTAKRTQRSMSKAYELRNSSLQFNFARSFDPRSFYRAEQTYQAALKLAQQQKYDEAKRLAGQAAKQFKSLVSKAKSQSAKQISGPLKRYKRSIKSDLASLKTSSNSLAVLQRVDGVSQRIRLDFGPRQWWDLNGDGILEPPYWVPPPFEPGPAPSSALTIEERTRNSIRLAWDDRSNNETGTRVLRSTDLFNWESIAEKGPIPILTVGTHTDQNLTPGTRYCYMIEVYNAEGARRSTLKCTYTRDDNNIPIWRLQLRVKMADFDGAGTDSTPRVAIGDDGQHNAVETYLDYGRDDFERGSEFTYDLNIGDIKDLSDITDLALVNYATGDDVMYIEEIALIINHDQGDNSLQDHTIFDRYFGTTKSSALTLSSIYRVEFAELRSDPLWQAYVGRSQAQPFLNIPRVTVAENNQFQLEIPADEIVSRLESVVGHMLYTDDKVKGKFKWGFLHGAAVETSQKDFKTLHVDLDLEATINNWPNPELDLDLDVELTKRCDAQNHQMIIDLTSKNITSSVDSSFWRDVTTLGLTELTDMVIAYLAEKCSPPEIKRSFAVPVPQNMNCESLRLEVQPEATATVCCFGINQ